MQFIDILRTQNTENFIQVEEYNPSMPNKRTGIMKVGNITWKQLRRFEYKNVCNITPCVKGDKKYLFIMVDDKEKSFYKR